MYVIFHRIIFSVIVFDYLYSMFGLFCNNFLTPGKNFFLQDIIKTPTWSYHEENNADGHYQQP